MGVEEGFITSIYVFVLLFWVNFEGKTSISPSLTILLLLLCVVVSLLFILNMFTSYELLRRSILFFLMLLQLCLNSLLTLCSHQKYAFLNFIAFFQAYHSRKNTIKFCMSDTNLGYDKKHQYVIQTIVSFCVFTWL